MFDILFNIGQRVLRAKSYFDGEEHQIGYVTGLLPKEVTFADNDHYLITVKGVTHIVPECQLVRILDWKCVNSSGVDPFFPIGWMDQETTHYYNEENNWILTRRPKENFRTAHFYQYLVPHPKDKNRLWYERRTEISQCNTERWI